MAEVAYHEPLIPCIEIVQLYSNAIGYLLFVAKHPFFEQFHNYMNICVPRGFQNGESLTKS